MKDYLNNAETKELIILSEVRPIVENFVKGQVLTKEEKSSLQRGGTTIKNTLLKIIERLGEKEAKKFYRAFTGSKVVVLTNSELEVIKKKKDAELDAAYEDNKEYFELAELTMDSNCKECSKKCGACNIYKHFENQCIPPINEEDNGTCPYAYK